MTMNEQEAIESIEYLKEQLEDDSPDMFTYTGAEINALNLAVQALTEIQQYREIGNVEGIKANMEELKRWHTDKTNPKIKNVFANTSTLICHNCDHKDDYIEDLEDYIEKLEAEIEIDEYRTIGTVEECRAAVEKQKAKIPKEYEDKFYGCPTCGNVLLHKWEKYPTKLMDKKNGLPYCLGCGQRILWEV